MTFAATLVDFGAFVAGALSGIPRRLADSGGGTSASAICAAIGEPTGRHRRHAYRIVAAARDRPHAHERRDLRGHRPRRDAHGRIGERVGKRARWNPLQHVEVMRDLRARQARRGGRERGDTAHGQRFELRRRALQVDGQAIRVVGSSKMLYFSMPARSMTSRVVSCFGRPSRM